MSRFITLEEALQMTGKYKKDKDGILKDNEKGKDILADSETVDKDKLLILLNRAGCAALRVYYGMDKDKKIHAIFVGVDADDRDILPPLNGEGTTVLAATTQESGYIVEESRRCPPDCATSGGL